jgi:hypothetical protein
VPPRATAWGPRSTTCDAQRAAPRATAGRNDQVPSTLNERRRGQRPSATTKYLRCTSSGAAGNGLGTSVKYLRAAAGIGLGTTIRYLRGAAGIGLGTTIEYLLGAAGIGLATTIKFLRGAEGIGLTTTFKCPSVCFCMGPGLARVARCVLK